MDDLVRALRSGEPLDAEGIHVRLSRQAAEVAADILEVVSYMLQGRSPHMSGEMWYGFRGNGWPMTHCRGHGQREAMLAVVAEVKRSREEMDNADEGV